MPLEHLQYLLWTLLSTLVWLCWDGVISLAFLFCFTWVPTGSGKGAGVGCRVPSVIFQCRLPNRVKTLRDRLLPCTEIRSAWTHQSGEMPASLSHKEIPRGVATVMQEMQMVSAIPACSSHFSHPDLLSVVGIRWVRMPKISTSGNSSRTKTS